VIKLYTERKAVYNCEQIFKSFEGSMRIGIIGGANHWKQWQQSFVEINQETPYGAMADVICAGTVAGHDVFTLQRHGSTYQLPMQDIPWRANVYGMYLQKLDFIIHLTACGSLRKTDNAGDLLLFDQLIDFTKKRPNTLGPPVINKMTCLDFSKPFSEILIQYSAKVLSENNIAHHVGGTMITEEGPKFSSMAETRMYRLWGADFINQTSCPEVYFCRELGLPVLPMGMVTNSIQQDYKISAEDIATNIALNKTVTPKALACLFQALPKVMVLEELDTASYNSEQFDLRNK
jgi:5'-methylthioadenosine phosphorylase